jgi:hypothetical protein
MEYPSSSSFVFRFFHDGRDSPLLAVKVSRALGVCVCGGCSRRKDRVGTDAVVVALLLLLWQEQMHNNRLLTATCQ